jgi:hypothetical protein
MKYLSILLILSLTSKKANAQPDTIRVCTYNLLNYGNAANPYATKDQWLAPIMQAISPAIVCYNEISTAVPGLPDTLKHDLPFLSEHGSVYNTNHQTQLSALYWKTGTFHLLKDTSICHNLRDIVAYELYYDYPGLSAPITIPSG